MMSREFSQPQKPINFTFQGPYLQYPHKNCIMLHLVLASEVDGVTSVPILLNACDAHELGETLLDVAEHLRKLTFDQPTQTKEGPANA